MATIVPAVAEETWQKQLVTLPRWQPPRAPVVVIAPHPDDESLGAGGLIAALRAWDVAVTVVAVTDGEHAYADLEPQQASALGALREQEQTASLARLGVAAEQIVRLRYPDSSVSAREETLTESLRQLVEPGMHIVAPWVGDFHPDHEACGRAAAVVAREKKARLTSYFFWTWHRGAPDTVRDLPLVRFDPTPAQQCAKLEAVACHRSQLQHPSGQPILSEELLAPGRRSFEVYMV